MTNPILETIDKTVKNNNIVLFMKGTKHAPMCGFSARVVHILHTLGLDYKDINVLENQEIREGIKEYSDWPTIPQLYLKGEFVGGCDIVSEMHQNGEFKALLQDKGLL